MSVKLEKIAEIARQVGISQPAEVEWTTIDGMFIKQMHIRNAGSFIPQHSHAYAHSSLLAAGQVHIWKNGKLATLDGPYRAPAIIYIEKGVKHTFMSLVDDTLIFCLHNLHGAEAVAVLEEHQLLDEVT